MNDPVNDPMSGVSLDRRRLIATLCAGLGASLLADAQRPALATSIADPEIAWRHEKDQFQFPPDYLALNAANLCATSVAVLQRQLEITRDINRDPSFENRMRYEADKETTRARLASLLGADADEIAITRNTSEGNATIIDGLQLGPGDEVIVWNQNHESNGLAWQIAAKRRGLRVVTVTTPPNPSSPDELLEPFKNAFTSRSRVIAFSHIANTSGVRLPARQLCALARERNVFSLVDGAQSFAVLTLDLHAMGCDFFTASGHKWLAGPRETGVLYVRKAAVGQVWPRTVTHGWSDAREQSARKFDCLGQQDDARIVALASAVDFHERIGRQRVQDRIVHLNAALRKKLVARVAGIELLTPSGPELSGGITSFTLPGPDAEKVRRKLHEVHRISAMAVPAGDRTLVRFCPHIYTLPEEIDRAVTAAATAV